MRKGEGREWTFSFGCERERREDDFLFIAFSFCCSFLLLFCSGCWLVYLVWV